MLLVVPNGKVKLLNALPFAPADLRRERLVDREVGDFLAASHERWDVAEEWYVTRVRPPSSFDLVVSPD